MKWVEFSLKKGDKLLVNIEKIQAIRFDKPEVTTLFFGIADRMEVFESYESVVTKVRDRVYIEE